MREERMEYTIDLTGVTDRQELQDRVAQMLALPEWYGGNLDALFDILTQMQGLIRVVGFEDAKQTLAEYARGFRTVCEDAVKETPGLHIVFADDEDESLTGSDGFADPADSADPAVPDDLTVPDDPAADPDDPAGL